MAYDIEGLNWLFPCCACSRDQTVSGHCRIWHCHRPARIVVIAAAANADGICYTPSLARIAFSRDNAKMLQGTRTKCRV
jgi:hypothetical protein